MTINISKDSGSDIFHAIRGVSTELTELYARWAIEHMHGVSIVMALPTLDKLHSLLQGRGCVDGESALVTASGYLVYVVDTNNDSTSAIAFSTGDGGHLAIMERSDPLEQEADEVPGKVRDVELFRWIEKGKRYGPYGLLTTLKKWQQDEWMESELLRSGWLLPPMFKDEEEYQYLPGEIVSGPEELFQWHAFFKEAIEEAGLLDAHIQWTKEVATRKFKDPISTSEVSRDGNTFGFQLALACHGLPGEEERKVATSLFQASVEGRLEGRAFPQALRIREMSKVVGADSQSLGFVFNDLEDSCFTIEVGDWVGISLQNQNKDFALLWKEDGTGTDLVVHQWPASNRKHRSRGLKADHLTSDSPSLLGVFRQVDGRLEAVQFHAEDIDQILSWNSVLLTTGSANASLQQDLKKLGA